MPTDAFGRSLLQRASGFAPRYLRTQLSLSSVSLVGGFVFDAVTLKRIDMLWENLWVVVHLLVVALCIFWVTHDESSHVEREAGAAKLDSRLIYLLQFVFGGLLSTFMVFYFRSGTFWVSWPFYLLLTAAFIANEKLKTWYARLEYQLSIFFLSLFCFMIFILPVALHAIGRLVFVLSGTVSLLLWWLFVGMLRARAKEGFFPHARTVFASTAVIFVVVNALYFMNVIPPLPLSLQDAGVYHSIVEPTPELTSRNTKAKDGWVSSGPPLDFTRPRELPSISTAPSSLPRRWIPKSFMNGRPTTAGAVGLPPTAFPSRFEADAMEGIAPTPLKAVLSPEPGASTWKFPLGPYWAGSASMFCPNPAPRPSCKLNSRIENAC